MRTNKIKSSDTSSVKQQLESDLEAKGLQPVDATLTNRYAASDHE